MAQLKIHLFGQPRLERDGVLVEISLTKAMALLAYMVTTRQPHGRDALATFFWPESDQSTARANLRRTLYALNKSVGENIVQADATSLALNPQVDIWLDVEEFTRLIRECVSISEHVGTECISPLAQAATLYKDDFLAGFTLPDCPAFDEWQFFEAERLRQTLARVLTQLTRAYQANEEWDRAIECARRWLALDPVHEPAHRQLMRLYAASGQHAAALRQYQRCVQVLHEELGAAPDTETIELYESIRLGKRVAVPISAFSPPITHYTQNGDIHIAYQVLGEGPVDIIFVGGFISDLEQIWEEPALAKFFQRMGSFSRLILFDKRGMGLSDRVGHAPTLENTMDDILAVMNAVGSARAVLLGVSEGGTSAALFAATYPERVAGLILYATMAKGTRSLDYPWVLSPDQFDGWLEMLTVNWGEALNLELYAPSRAQDERLQRWWAKSLRIASSPGEVRGVLEVLKGIDVRVALPAIRARTLVIHRTGDRAIRVGNGRFIAAQIPGARFLELPGIDHWWWIGDSESILTAIETFLRELAEPTASEQVLATILAVKFGQANTDMRQARRGTKWMRFHALLTKHVAHARGREIQNDDDRFTGLFDGPSRAIQCAISIRQSAWETGVPVRAGLHTGEVPIRGTKGIALQAAVDIMERAEIGQVLISSTVKDLVIGSGFQFTDQGEQVLPSLGAWHLYALAGT